MSTFNALAASGTPSPESLPGFRWHGTLSLLIVGLIAGMGGCDESADPDAGLRADMSMVPAADAGPVNDAMPPCPTGIEIASATFIDNSDADRKFKTGGGTNFRMLVSPVTKPGTTNTWLGTPISEALTAGSSADGWFDDVEPQTIGACPPLPNPELAARCGAEMPHTWIVGTPGIPAHVFQAFNNSFWDYHGILDTNQTNEIIDRFRHVAGFGSLTQCRETCSQQYICGRLVQEGGAARFQEIERIGDPHIFKIWVDFSLAGNNTRTDVTTHKKGPDGVLFP